MDNNEQMPGAAPEANPAPEAPAEGTPEMPSTDTEEEKPEEGAM